MSTSWQRRQPDGQSWPTERMPKSSSSSSRGGFGSTSRYHKPLNAEYDLGGLVIKQALVDAADNKAQSHSDGPVLDSCIGLFLFGVPNKPLKEENMSSLLKGKKSEPFMISLREGSDFLEVLRKNFCGIYKNYLESCHVVSFYETKDSPTVKEAPDGTWKRDYENVIRMVTKDSAVSCTPEEQSRNQIPISSNHSKLVKFSGRADYNYITFCTKMRDLIVRIQGIISEHDSTVGELSEKSSDLSPPRSVTPEPTTGVPVVVVSALSALETAITRIGSLSKSFTRKFETERKTFIQYILDIFDGRENSFGMLELYVNPSADERRKIVNATYSNGYLPGDSLLEVESLNRSIEKFLGQFSSSNISGDRKPEVTGMQSTHNLVSESSRCRNKFDFRKLRNLLGKRSNQSCHMPRTANKESINEINRLLQSVRKCNKKLAKISDLKYHQSVEILKSRAPVPVLEIVEYTAPTRSSEYAKRRLVDSRHVRSISKKLHGALAQCVLCNCHEVLMRLEISQNSVSCINEAAVQPPIQFSLLITDNPFNKVLGGRHMRLDIGQDLSPEREVFTSKAFKLCAEELHDAVHTNTRLPDGFLVFYNESDNQVNNQRRSLKQLLEEQKDELRLAGQLNLGLKLGNAAIYFHSSPWINQWDKDIVTVFTSDKQQRFDSLMLHIPGKLNTGDSKTAVCDLYLLGLMLLEVAGKDSSEFQQMETVRGRDLFVPNWGLVSSLSREVGIHYKNLVQAVLQAGMTWSGNVENDDLESLVQLVGRLREFLKDFS